MECSAILGGVYIARCFRLGQDKINHIIVLCDYLFSKYFMNMDQKGNYRFLFFGGHLLLRYILNF